MKGFVIKLVIVARMLGTLNNEEYWQIQELIYFFKD